jgi:hypothetical protein
MYTLATLHQLRARLNLGAAETADDARLINALEAAAAGIERATGRRFSPHRLTRLHDYTNPVELLLEDDLLDLVSITNGDGSTVALTDVIRLPDTAPHSVLRLTGSSAFLYMRSPLEAISVTGIWGWHERWSTAWRGTGDTVQNNPLTGTATALTVADADGADSIGESPRFQVGHLLKIDDEYLRVVSVNTTSNVLTVLRGVNGTTAAAHNLNALISSYQPPPDVEAVALRWAAWLYREPDTSLTAEPLDLLDSLDRLQRPRVRV